MKRTCNGCRASGINGRCELGYKTEVKNSLLYVIDLEWKPSEKCPKPKTNEELLRLERKEPE